MTDLFDTSSVPDDNRHWDEMAKRVAARAIRDSNPTSLDWLSRSRGGIIAASLLVVATAVYAVLAGRKGERHFDAISIEAFAPTDELGRAIALESGPPQLGTLLMPVPAGAKR